MEGHVEFILDRYMEALKGLLEGAPRGSWLCAHEDFGVVIKDESTYVLNQKYHIIGDPSECTEKVRKSQYFME